MELYGGINLLLSKTLLRLNKYIEIKFANKLLELSVASTIRFSPDMKNI